MMAMVMMIGMVIKAILAEVRVIVNGFMRNPI
jgi:hypothetical protein